MKLLQYTSRIYLIYLLAIFVIVSGLIYFVINRSVNEELDERIELTRDMIFRQIKHRERVVSMPPYWEIERVSKKHRHIKISRDTIIQIPHEEREEIFRQKVYFRKAKDRDYRIVVRTPKTGSAYLLLIVALPTLLIIILLLISLAVVNRRISKRIWRPFYHNLAALGVFSITDNTEIDLQKSEIDEFEQLRKKLLQITNKLRRDYQNLKQFTENASHEIQTPLSIIITRLEQLMNTQKLNPALAKEIGNIFSSAKRLSRLNQTLLLLSKIENRQYDQTEEVNLSALLHQQLDSLQELIEVKSLQVKLDIEPDVVVTANPDLAGMLLTNLLSNAIRHNQAGGEIRIKLCRKDLHIGNTGISSDEDPGKWFGRFAKGDPSSSSPGLGLALVKEITELYGWNINYTIEDQYHHLKIEFYSNKIQN